MTRAKSNTSAEFEVTEGDAPLSNDAIKALAALLVDAAERDQQTDPADAPIDTLERR